MLILYFCFQNNVKENILEPIYKKALSEQNIQKGARRILQTSNDILKR